MTIPIKIQCECGQPYAFDVEPVEGRMPAVVACPACGADGTLAANTIIAESLSTQAAPVTRRIRLEVATPAPAVRLAVPAPSTSAPSLASRRAGAIRQVDPGQVRHEARAKIFWGDPPEEVVKYLMIQGVAVQEASEMVNELYKERAATTRANGIRMIVAGAAMVCVPIVAWIGFLRVGYLPLKLFAVFVIIGLYGAYRVLKGTIMFMAPKSEPGDVADQ